MAPASARINVAANGNIRSESIGRVAGNAGDTPDALLHHHLRAMAKKERTAVIDHNEARLLIDGPQSYKAMFDAMEKAQDHINLEVYIFEDDEIGHRLQQTLLRKQRQGVQVNLIYDSLGSLTTPKSIFDELREAGARVYEFNPVNPAKGKILDINNRDHRKILVVDGKVGFTGGINISSVYSQGSGVKAVTGSSKKKRKANEAGWRDTQIEVHGPAVAEMQRIFFSTWDQQKPEVRQPQPGLEPEYFPLIPVAGDKVLRVIASSTNDKENLIYTDMLAAITHAKRSVHLTMAYFSPDSNTIEALQNAAMRGVDVVLVLPGFSDVRLVLDAGRSHYTALLKAGVKIYERHDALLHAKTAVIDGVWSTVGSTNMDMRSFLHNNEVNIVVLGIGFGAEMEEMFNQDVAQARQITEKEWKERGVSMRMRQWFSRVWSFWL
ncbi:MAG TPA: cardiolipin synthase [Dongiaceae bacterium]|nr:cardiolipin synthase [Dongiaceae bacterium]